MRSTALIAALLVGAGMLTPATAQAQSPKQPSVEFALLSSINYIIRYTTYVVRCDTLVEWCPDRPEESQTAITFPSILPGARLTIWSTHPVLIDAALSWIRVSGEDGVKSENLMMELGLGMDLARRTSTDHPFVGIIGGVAVPDQSDPATYVGALVGLRHFVRDYAALRFQIGYRATINRADADLRSVEFTGGIGFIL